MVQRKRIGLRWTAEAQTELREIFGFYRKRNGSVVYGRKIRDDIGKRLNQIREWPETGEVIEDGPTRFFIVDHFVVVFEFDRKENNIVVHAVRDGRRETVFD